MSADADPLSVLTRIRRTAAQDPAGERCELCAEDISSEHRHLVDLETRNLLCGCRPCSLLFAHEGAAGGRYRAVPDRYLALSGFSLGPAEWDALQIPVGMAFFFTNSRLGRTVAFYPSPAGATECELAMDTWTQVVEANPVLATVEADVEAALVRTEGAASMRAAEAGSDGGAEAGPGAMTECFIVPIDACYELVGHLRRLWRGFDGGREARDQIGAFFAGVRSRARLTSAGSGCD